MAAGSFITENKVRPGCYINMKGVAKASSTLADRGTVALILPLSFGGQVTEITMSDILSGDCVKKGFPVSNFTDATNPIHFAYPYVNKLIICRSNLAGSVAATGGLQTADSKGALATASFPGINGNNISIVVSAIPGVADKMRVKVSYNGVVVDTQDVEDSSKFVDDGYVVLSGGEGSLLVATAGVDLSGGSDGTESQTDLTAIFTRLSTLLWNTLAYCGYTSTVSEGVTTYTSSSNIGLVVNYVRDLRENNGKYRQLVVYRGESEAATDDNYEGLIVVEQYFVNTDDVQLYPDSTVAFVAALTAGTNIGESNTYHDAPGEFKSVYPQYLTTDAVVAELNDGRLIFTTTSDERLVIEKDINSLHVFSADRTYPFSKNRCIRSLDEIANSKVKMWESTYCGKVDNNPEGRELFRSDVMNILTEVRKLNGIQSFNSDDITVEQGNNVDEVRSYERIQPTDSMEILYSYVTVLG